MLEEIRIDNLGVITSARLPLGPGLTVLTGETGAGKTMVLTGLGLLLGVKADSATVRSGASTAAVEGRVRVPVASAVLDRALEAGAVLDDDGTLVLVRTVAAEGRSRAVVGGRGVPQALLGELTDELVTVHGQADQARLRSPARQRLALDDFAGPEHDGRLREYRAAWARRTQALAERHELIGRAQERAREAELLRLGLAEIERTAPLPGEDVELTALSERLGHVEELRAATTLAHTALAGDEVEQAATATGLVEHARRQLEHVAAHDAQLAALVARLTDLSYQLVDVGAELSSFLGGLEADPVRLEAVERRRAELGALTRRFGPDLAAVDEWARTASARLVELDGGTDRVEALDVELATLDATLEDLAGRLTQARTDAAGRLADAVTRELASLAMGGASLLIEVTGDEPGPWGRDRVVMNLVPHPGAPARPLGKGASGGELSRVMLAIEVALATSPTSGAHTPSTFVFDEVDAGVGGQAAVEVGRRLAALARGAQVVVVTHLAQVAAFADRHLVVLKQSRSGDASVTESDVRAVDGPDRVRELARMLSGQQDSDTARAHAAELLALADVGR